MLLTKDFYNNQSTIELAKNLLGKKLVHHTHKGIVSGMIVETEAYLLDDPASHSFLGKNLKNKSMFEDAGTAYVYFIYGNYYCFNVVTNIKDYGEAVLIRALEPIEGIKIMQEFRNKENIYELCSGPGKLCIALDINKSTDGKKLYNKNSRIYIESFKDFSDEQVQISSRIGIAKARDSLYRFFLKDNGFISKNL